MFPFETGFNSLRHAKLEYHATVRELPSNERPRERLQHFDPQALSTAELLAIVLNTGSRGGNVLDLTNKLKVRESRRILGFTGLQAQFVQAVESVFNET